MIAKIKELRKNEEGFTLIELMVVVLIIGVLAAIAIPVFLNLQKEGLKASVKSDVKNTVTNVATFLASKPQATLTELNNATTGAKKVVSAGNSVVIGGTAGWSDYTVTGKNAAATFAYQFQSAGAEGGTYKEITYTP